LAPPLSYSLYNHEVTHANEVTPVVVNDYKQAVQLAKAQHKPILIDFTGWACVNCRKMEEHVWTDPEITAIIQSNYILVSLYVDDREKLPPAERFTYTSQNGIEKDIITQGDRWAVFQAENFNQVTQPLYAILTPDEKLVTNPVGYTPNVSDYKQWLECGVSAFQTPSQEK
jgi:uncharacterized protein YyaL (SSP411 family)